VEDKKLYRCAVLLETWFLFDGKKVLHDNLGFQFLSVKRSVAMYQQAVNNGCSYLFAGIVHAYHIESLGFPAKIFYCGELSDASKAYENDCLKVYQNYLSKVTQHGE